jgi:hypothetical protein
MIPKGDVYFSLREKMLDFYSGDLKPDLRNRSTLGEWLITGIYTVQSITPNEIIIEASKEDISSSCFSEIEFLYNSSYEQILEIANFISDKKERSDAWSIVTLYYLGYFVSQALLRILGSPIVFLKKDLINNVLKMKGSSVKLGSGSFVIHKIKDISINKSEYKIRKLKGRLHEECWRNLYQILEENIGKSKDVDEIIFYNNILNKKLFKIYEEHGWPSGIRNKANYRPGFAYRLVEKKVVGKTRNAVINNYIHDPINYLKNLCNSMDRCIINDKEDDFDIHVELLYLIIWAYVLLLKELYKDLLERKRVDKRMSTYRKNFLKNILDKNMMQYLKD